jgi:hypothetical protein
VRQEEPAIDTVEKGLRAAQAAGVLVDLDGAAQKPPAAALEVTRTGFGPESVPPQKPVPPPKPVPAQSPLGRAAAVPHKHSPTHRPAAPAGLPFCRLLALIVESGRQYSADLQGCSGVWSAAAVVGLRISDLAGSACSCALPRLAEHRRFTYSVELLAPLTDASDNSP